MADIYQVSGIVVSTSEPFLMRCEFEQSAELLVKALENLNEFKDVSYEQKF